MSVSESTFIPSGWSLGYSDTENGVYQDVGITKANSDFVISYDISEVLGSKAEQVIKAKKNQKGAISGELYAINSSNLTALNPDYFTEVDVAGTPVAGETDTLASGGWSYGGFNVIENQNGDGSAITVNSVTGGTDGLLVEDTDYTVGADSNGDYGVTIIDSVTVTTLAQDMVIDYDYTPNASKSLQFGSTTTSVGNKFWKLTYINPENSKETYVKLYKASNEGDVQISFLDQASDDALSLPFEITGVVDTDRTDGDRIGVIYTEDPAFMA